MLTELPVKSCAVYLNRACPRNCPYCEISKEKKQEMTIKEWKVAFDNLNKQLGVEFFLILGNEPLLLGEKLIELVAYLKERHFYYAMYSTSPPELLSKYGLDLVNAGLSNWSSGIDFIEPAYMKACGRGYVSNSVKSLVARNAPNLIKKAEESLDGLDFMEEHCVQTHALITVSRMNYQFLPEMLEWFKEERPNTHVGFSCVEWKTWDRMDFAVDKKTCGEYAFKVGDNREIEEMVERFIKMREAKKFYTQIPNSYVKNINDYGIYLDWKCWGYQIPSIDCDGTFRTCGYCRGERSAKHNVLLFNEHKLLQDWEADVRECPGCYWAFSWIAKSADNSNELFHIEELKGRVIE